MGDNRTDRQIRASLNNNVDKHQGAAQLHRRWDTSNDAVLRWDATAWCEDTRSRAAGDAAADRREAARRARTN